MTEAEALDRLAAADTSLISDAASRIGLQGIWLDGLRAVGPAAGSIAVGRARTLLYAPARGDGGGWTKSLYATIAECGPGSVLVIAGQGTDENLLGDNVAGQAQACELSAIVTDSHVRDLTGMSRLEMPVFARGFTTRLRKVLEPVAFDVPVVCAGALVRPGDIVVGGEDGVLALPVAAIPQIAAQLEELVEIEAEAQAAIQGRAPAAAIEAVLRRKKSIQGR